MFDRFIVASSFCACTDIQYSLDLVKPFISFHTVAHIWGQGDTYFA